LILPTRGLGLLPIDPTTPTPPDDGLQQFLLLLGSGLTAAGQAVSEIESDLTQAANAYGAPDARIAALPTFIIVALDPTRPATIEPTRQLGGGMRLDQTSALYQTLKLARDGEVDPADGTRQVLDAAAMRPRFGLAVTLIGHVMMTAGICLLQRPTWEAALLAAGFGLVVGGLRVAASGNARAETLMPVLAAFIVAAVTFVLADQGWATRDVKALIAPLVTFLPGAALTMAVIELAAGAIVTGASRLVYGAMRLVLLAAGIVAAAQAIGPVPPGVVAHNSTLLPVWCPWLGVFVFGIGVAAYHSAPNGSVLPLFAVLITAFAGQQVGAALLGAIGGAFLGALAMTPMARLVEGTRKGPPMLVTFLPAFWLLVPGSLGLRSVAAYLGADHTAAVNDLLGTIGSMVAISLGVLLGYPVASAVVGARRLTVGRYLQD
jgi:uncharacterized membrane protein YjjP (DUF1212 family)